MPSRDLPITKYPSRKGYRIALISLLGCLIALAVLIHHFFPIRNDPALAAFAGMLLILFVHRLLVRRVFRLQLLGLNALRQNDYEKAISHFDELKKWAERHAFLDRHRASILMLSLACPIRELALFNIAECLWNLGRWDEALEIHRNILKENPENRLSVDFMKRFESQKAYLEGRRGGENR